jgi:hypothetical protein
MVTRIISMLYIIATPMIVRPSVKYLKVLTVVLMKIKVFF